MAVRATPRRLRFRGLRERHCSIQIQPSPAGSADAQQNHKPVEHQLRGSRSRNRCHPDKAPALEDPRSGGQSRQSGHASEGKAFLQNCWVAFLLVPRRSPMLLFCVPGWEPLLGWMSTCPLPSALRPAASRACLGCLLAGRAQHILKEPFPPRREPGRRL